MSDATAAQREAEWAEICSRVSAKLAPVVPIPTIIPVAILSGDKR